jgi:nicotinamidase-related amidase
MAHDHGNFPDQSKVALLLIDVINDLNFPQADMLMHQALPMAEKLAALKRRAEQNGIAAIYVNDNFGRWKSDFRQTVQHCTNDDSKGAVISRQLVPQENDYFVLKPMHSGFYSTTLDVLLEHLHVDTLVLTGIATNICVLFTANDAYMRGFSLYVPKDCVAANTEEEGEYSLKAMKNLLKADTRPSTDLELAHLGRRNGEHLREHG